MQPVNIDLIPNWKNVDQRLQDAPWHTVDGKHYGVPYQWGPNVLMYNTDAFKEAPTSWNVVFEEQNLPDGKSNKGRVQAYDGADLHRRRRALSDGEEARARHQGPLRAERGPVQGGARPAAPAQPLVQRYWHDATVQTDDFTNEGVVASGSWPYQVNLLQADKQPIASIRSPRKAPPAGPTPR